MPIGAYLGRFAVCSAIVISTSGATWINPPTHPAAATAEPSQRAIIPQIGGQVPPTPGDDAVADSGIKVTRWEFSPAIPGRPVYLSMTFDGAQTAIDQMHTSPLMIQVHWVREDAESTPGAPDLVTDLTIGRQDLAGALEGEVRRTGSFEWHSWAKKDTLSPGTWVVSLTYPNGQPLSCGQDAQPCRFTINIG
jgi:hypothetical protein